MTIPITDIPTLANEYAVKGYTWAKRADGSVYLHDEYLEIGIHDGNLVVWGCPYEPEPINPDVAIAVCCAHKGIPTPWRAAERLMVLARGHGSLGIGWYNGKAEGCAEAARYLRGEPHEQAEVST